MHFPMISCKTGRVDDKDEFCECKIGSKGQFLHHLFIYSFVPFVLCHLLAVVVIKNGKRRRKKVDYTQKALERRSVICLVH